MIDSIVKLLLLTVIMPLGCSIKDIGIAPAEPTTLPAAELSEMVRRLPDYADFGISGLAFLDSRLFVSTNVGLLEVVGGDPKRLYQWYRDDNVVSGPWYDESRTGIWIQRAKDGRFVRLDREGWHRIDLPEPPDNYFSRGDFMNGFEGVGDTIDFRLVGAGYVWKWTDTSTWTVTPLPPAEEFSSTIGFARCNGRELYVVRTGAWTIPPCVYRAYWSDSVQWRTHFLLPVGSVQQVVSASRGIFIRGDKEKLLRLDADTSRVLSVPGPCESITRTSGGRLLASFRGAGIYMFDSDWIKLFDEPYAPAEGEHRAYLAENKGLVALATTTVHHLKPGEYSEWETTGTNALWISDGSMLVRVELIEDSSSKR